MSGKIHSHISLILSVYKRFHQIWPTKKPYITRFNWAWNFKFLPRPVKPKTVLKPVLNNRNPVCRKNRY